MTHFAWHASPDHTAAFHLEQAFERSQIGVAEMTFSAAICFTAVIGMLIGVAAPPPPREAPGIVRMAPDDECSLAELACGYTAIQTEPLRRSAAVAR